MSDTMTRKEALTALLEKEEAGIMRAVRVYFRRRKYIIKALIEQETSASQ